MESAKEELQRNRDREEQRAKEISKLKLESSKREADSKKWKDEASAKTVRAYSDEHINIHLHRNSSS